MRLYQILGVFILFVATQAAEEIAVVTEGKINVRGKPSLIGEVITQLERGEKVTVLERITNSTADPGEPTNWAKINLPPNTPVWVFAPFVKDGKVSVSRLNVRAGRGENYSVIGRLNRDEAVKPIRTVEEWMEIEQPTNAYAFVDMSLLQFEGDSTAPVTPAVVAQPAQATPKVAATGTEAGTTNQTETVAAATVTTPTTAEQPSLPPDNAQETPAAQAPPTTASAATPANNETVPKAAVVPPAPEVASKPETAAVPTPEPVPGTEPEQVATTAEPSVTATSEQPATSPLPATENLPQVAPPVVTRSEPPPKRVVRREGIVRATSSIQAPTWYELVHADTKKRINYLFEENMGINLKDYRGQKVVVSGEEAIDPRWPNTPILDMQTLDVLPNDSR